MMLNDSNEDGGCGGDHDVMLWPNVECETLQYERGIRPSIGRKPPGKTRFPAVFLSTNPGLQRHYERRIAKMDVDRRHREQRHERAQRVFFLQQAFDHDSNLRFGQQIIKKRVDNDTGRIRHRKQKRTRLLDLIGRNGSTSERGSLPRLGTTDCDTSRTSHSLDVATGASEANDHLLGSVVETKSMPVVPSHQEDPVTLPSIATAKSYPSVSDFDSEQNSTEGAAAGTAAADSSSEYERKRREKKTKPVKEFRRQLSTIVEPVGHAYFSTYGPEMSPLARTDNETPGTFPTGDVPVQGKCEPDTVESIKQANNPVPSLPVEEMGESSVKNPLDHTQVACLPPIKTFITAPSKTSEGPLTRGVSLFDRSANAQDETHASQDNEIIARITRTLPTTLMRKMTLNEALLTHKQRLLENSRKFASRDLFADPRWKRLERVLKDDCTRR